MEQTLKLIDTFYFLELTEWIAGEIYCSPDEYSELLHWTVADRGRGMNSAFGGVRELRWSGRVGITTIKIKHCPSECLQS